MLACAPWWKARMVCESPDRCAPTSTSPPRDQRYRGQEYSQKAGPRGNLWVSRRERKGCGLNTKLGRRVRAPKAKPRALGVLPQAELRGKAAKTPIGDWQVATAGLLVGRAVTISYRMLARGDYSGTEALFWEISAWSAVVCAFALPDACRLPHPHYPGRRYLRATPGNVPSSHHHSPEVLRWI